MIRVSAQDGQQVQPGIGIRLAEAPEARRDDPRARLYVVDHVKPGTTFKRRIEVSNGTAETALLELRALPAEISDGSFGLVLEGENEVTEWIDVSPSEVELPPQTRRVVVVQFDVPRDAPAGEHYAGVAALRVVGDAEGARLVSGVAVRVYLSVGAGGEPPIDFDLPAFRPVRGRDGRPAIEIDGCNTGGRAVDLAGEVSLDRGPGGIKAGPFPTPNATTLAPDQCHTFTIPLDKELPLGPWDATAKLRSGKEERTAQARITFPKEAGERGKKVETREVTGTLPGIIATGISIFLLLLLAGWLFWFLLKRRKRKKDDEEERGG